MIIARVVFLRFREVSTETPFTLPKPLVHLWCRFVNVVLAWSTRGGRTSLH